MGNGTKILLALILLAVILASGCVGGDTGIKEAAKFAPGDTQEFMYMKMTENVRDLIASTGAEDATLANKVEWIATVGSYNGVEITKFKSTPSQADLKLSLDYVYTLPISTEEYKGITIYGQEAVTGSIEKTEGDVASTSEGASTLADNCKYSNPPCDKGDDAAVDDSHAATGGSGFTMCEAGSGTCQFTIDLGTTRKGVNEIRTHFWDLDMTLGGQPVRDYYGYAIDLSTDGKSWERVVDKLGMSVSGRVNEEFTATDARYIKYTGKRNTYNEKFHIIEVDAFTEGEVDKATTSEKVLDKNKEGYAIIDGKILLKGSVSWIQKSIRTYKGEETSLASKISEYTSAVPVKDMYIITAEDGLLVASMELKESIYTIDAVIGIGKTGDYLSAAAEMESGLVMYDVEYTRKDKGNFVVFTIKEMSLFQFPIGL